MTIYWWYDLWELKKKLLVLNVETIRLCLKIKQKYILEIIVSNMWI